MSARLPPHVAMEASWTRVLWFFFPLDVVTGALPVVLTRGLWRWISHINEKGRLGGLPDSGSHGSAVSTACSNSPVSANCWRTNKEAEAAYHHNKSSLGVGRGWRGERGGLPGARVGGGDQEGEGQRCNHGGARGAGVRGSQKREVGGATAWWARASLLRSASVSSGASECLKFS